MKFAAGKYRCRCCCTNSKASRMEPTASEAADLSSSTKQAVQGVSEDSQTGDAGWAKRRF